MRSFAATFVERERPLPGFSEQFGLIASWMRRMKSKSASEKRSGMSSLFFHADAMLAGEAAANFNAVANDFGGGL